MGLSSQDSLAGLFPILRQIRSRAGLTQQQIARATGAGGGHGHKLIARLEAGHVSNPSVKLVLDYLRACRATSLDLADFLDAYLSAPLAIPSRLRRGRPRAWTVPERGLSPKPEDAATLALRKEASWWRLRRLVEQILHEELTRLGAKPMSEERKAAALYGGKVFRSLYRTRGSRPGVRERRLERCHSWAAKKGMPDEIRNRVFDVVSALFAEMDDKGQLDLLPPVEEARHLLLLKPGMRFVTDEAMCHHEFVMREYKRHLAHEAARKPVIEAAMNMVRSTGLSPQKLGNYPGAIIGFLNVAENTLPGSAARDQRLAEVLGRFQRPDYDQALLHRLAELIMTLRDQRV